MKSLVVYDSAFGNTETVALAIASTLGEGTIAVRAGDVTPEQLKDLDLLVLGSPTQGGRPLPSTLAFLRTLHSPGRAAAFDTRIEPGNNVFFRGLFAVIGFAAPKLAKGLRSKGATLVAGPEGFIVEGNEGPLRTGELERAKTWAASLARSAGAA